MLRRQTLLILLFLTVMVKLVLKCFRDLTGDHGIPSLVGLLVRRVDLLLFHLNISIVGSRAMLLFENLVYFSIIKPFMTRLMLI
jgi:hypothetical protein